MSENSDIIIYILFNNLKMAIPKNIKFKLSIRSLRDAENARLLYNKCISSKSYKQAIQVANALSNAGYKGWDEKVDAVLNILARR